MKIVNGINLQSKPKAIKSRCPKARLVQSSMLNRESSLN